ncbi:hypothetical protein SAMN05216284_101464 [Micromonospora sediminimaris]|uniref:Tryptophan-associated transmembrane protein (Trp_oprn_chp) n=2 Tax=Micromonospora sediminimaris TaxID=547162 RepID=A0A9W5XI32_9ACTN|nr:hypothetical protein Vse01_09990 [Micromonospora sediminimaris]SFB88099.1 hypothetical protein SAMN05216284_101464 [Micromonospora sediminimaris]
MSTAKQNPMSSVFSVDIGMLLATLLALVGYLLPWFRPRPRAQWSFSGWAYASLSDGSGGGWTLLTFGWLLLAAGAALWARQVMAAAMAGMVAAVGTLVTAMAVVSASFGMIGERSALDYVTELPFGAGIPIMAAGIGLLLATSCRAIIRCHLLEATLDRHDPPTP